VQVVHSQTLAKVGFQTVGHQLGQVPFSRVKLVQVKFSASLQARKVSDVVLTDMAPQKHLIILHI
jgi:hypothetical protein